MDGDRRKQVGDALGRLHALDPAIRQLRKTTQDLTLNMRAHWGLADQRAALNSKGLSGALKSRQGGDVPGTLAFTCNICGRPNKRPMASIQREESSCDGCGSTVRCRAVAHVLSTALFGRCLTISDFPDRPDIVAWGLSDWDGYALRLREKFSYTNTFYHTEPRLDITNITPSDIGRLDVLISSDVFEHVSPPVRPAFKNARLLLKPDGFLILTVPYGLQPETIEHYPRLHDFVIEGEADDRRLVNITAEGEQETFSNLVFHGGDGSTLEMRIFSKDGLLDDLREAGFSRVAVQSDPCFEHGIYWWLPWSLPIVARP
jgi:hypothetical protein